MKKAVFFDLDDTLYPYQDSNAKIQSELEAISHFCKKYPKFTFLEAMATYKKVKRAIRDRLSDYPACDNRELWFLEFMQKEGLFDRELLQEMEDIYWGYVQKNAVPYYDAGLILPYLAKKYILGVITNGIKAPQEKKLKALGFTGYFDYIITSSEAGFDKPHTDIFRLALRRAKVRAKEAVMIGDNPAFDIYPANKLGMTTVWLRRGKRYYYPIVGKMKAKHTISHFLELKKWL
ncbi:HAD-IA family hydrolase [Candidatus Woesearchaeota archaeon]|nr:HAD-IA family hydrolase [Candidatus Woesearchaeota archaeon]